MGFLGDGAPLPTSSGGFNWSQVGASMVNSLLSPVSVIDPSIEVEWQSYTRTGPTEWLPKGQPGPAAGSKSAWVETGNTRAAGSAPPVIPVAAAVPAVQTYTPKAAIRSAGTSYLPYVLGGAVVLGIIYFALRKR